ncbi:MAG: Omp28-related outer membrane protein [Bacteroidales bacterium]|nr:Omp28-related outer membrane protein [Bacteroidales bacterium]
MKKVTIFVASLMLLFALKTNAQNERMLLLESFTNTGCGPCALYNPAMDALIAANPDKIVAIKYHVSWPSANDPMYLHNTSENGARTSYYGVTAVPHVVIDGNRFDGAPNQINQNIINQLQAIESPVEMRLGYEIDEAANTITVHVMGLTSQALTGNIKLYVGVIEKEIHFNSAPGPNGERDFYSVMKKLLPSSSGESLGALEAGDFFAASYTWELANIYDMSQVSAIAWIQNTNTKEVYQACGESESFQPFFANEASVSDVSNVKSTNCSGEAEPKVVLTNFGSNTLTSAELEVFVNGVKIKTVPWTGNLPTYVSQTVELGAISFAVEEENLLEVRINSVNGGTDEAVSNNIASCSIKGAPENIGSVLRLSLRTDTDPEQTTWKVTNLNTGEVVLEGGPYTEPNTMHNITLDITGDGCYDFTIYDAGGDGFTGVGLYGLKAGGTTLFSGREFTDSESNEFSYEVTASTDETPSVATNIYPNPTSGMVNIVGEGEQNVVIYNMAGQRVFEGVSKGYLQIDMTAYGAGIYAITVGNETQRIIVR